MSKALFIMGTGTDIGKTYVAGLIVKKIADAWTYIYGECIGMCSCT